jgi:hypothetical protein
MFQDAPTADNRAGAAKKGEHAFAPRVFYFGVHRIQIVGLQRHLKAFIPSPQLARHGRHPTASR